MNCTTKKDFSFCKFTIKDKNLSADCAIVLTDGYVEDNVQWDIDIPTLWMVTENRGFRPPVGRMVKIENI